MSGRGVRVRVLRFVFVFIGIWGSGGRGIERTAGGGLVLCVVDPKVLLRQAGQRKRRRKRKRENGGGRADREVKFLVEAKSERGWIKDIGR